jgi:hypothetical protein
MSLVQERIPVRTRVIPTWAMLLVGYALSRVFTTMVLLAFSAAGPHWSISHFDGGSGFLGFLNSWDGLYYGRIAEHGYPMHLPYDSSGDVAKNPWAFLPLYPLAARSLMVVTGLAFPAAGAIVSMVAGGAATFALHRLLRIRFGATTALWGALFFCFGPLSYVLQVTYAESLFLFLMFASLAAMMTRRYVVMLPFAILACFAHPGGIVLAAALALQRFGIAARREPAGKRERAAAWTSAVLMGLAGIAWPFVAGLATGKANAYFDTESAWWRDYIGQIHFFPFTPWFVFASHYWGFLGLLLVVTVLAGFAWWFTARSNRVLGPDIRAYTFGWVAYLVAVFLPQQSLFRMLLPLSPLLGHPALSRSPRRRRITLAVCILLQPVAILLFWVVWPP